MTKYFLVLSSILFLSSCASVNDVRERNPIIQKTVKANYKNLAGCFEEAYAVRLNSVSGLKKLETSDKVALLAVSDISTFGVVNSMVGWEIDFINLTKNSTKIVVYPDVSLGREYSHRIIKETLAGCLD